MAIAEILTTKQTISIWQFVDLLQANACNLCARLMSIPIFKTIWNDDIINVISIALNMVKFGVDNHPHICYAFFNEKKNEEK